MWAAAFGTIFAAVSVYRYNIGKMKRNNENIATTREGMSVKTENIEIYFKFV